MQASTFKIPLYKVFMSHRVGPLINEVLNSGYIGQGETVESFENELRKYFGPAPCHLLTVNSCTSALELALHLIGAPGGEVLVSPLNCFAGVSSVLSRGMRPRWVDVEALGNIDLTDVMLKLSPSTVAILFPHYCGVPVDLRELYKVLRSHADRTGKNVWVIEDCAHALGSRYQGEKIGCQHQEVIAPYPWTMKCFSFQAVKNLTTGDGGALVVPNANMLARAKLLRWYGLDRDKDRYTQDIIESGFKFQMNNIAAAIGLINLQSLDELTTYHVRNWQFYQSALMEFPEIVAPMLSGDSSACPLYPIWVEDRISFEAHMRDLGVEVAPAHVRSDKYSCVRQYKEKLRGVDDTDKHLTCLPAGWWINRDYIIDTIREWAGRRNVQS